MDIGELVQRVFSGRGGAQIVIDPRTNALICIAPDEKTQAQVEALLKELDKPASNAADSGYVIRSVALSAANAHQVTQQLLALYAPDRGPGFVRIVPDTRANMLWLSGDAERVAQFEQVARQMDEAHSREASASGATKPELRFYTIRQVFAAPLAETINDVLKAMQIDLHVVADSQSNQIVAFADAGRHAHIAQLVKTLDTASPLTTGQEAKPEKP
jgi:type II secretory pathway component GspD/PulD (secretin)